MYESASHSDSFEDIPLDTEHLDQVSALGCALQLVGCPCLGVDCGMASWQVQDLICMTFALCHIGMVSKDSAELINAFSSHPLQTITSLARFASVSFSLCAIFAHFNTRLEYLSHLHLRELFVLKSRQNQS